MNTTGIEELLEKYYEGLTSLEEETQLMEFFLGSDIPPRLAVHAEHFRYLHLSGKEEIGDPEFVSKVLDRLEISGTSSLGSNSRRWIYVTSLAATLLLLAGILFTFRYDIVSKLTAKRLSEQYTSPETAYAEATKALLLVSVNFNAGLDQISGITKFNKGLESMEPFSKYSKFQPITFNPGEQKIHQ
jgi:hypothetical protein